MKFQGTKVSYKGHTTYYHHGQHQSPKNRIELDVTRYGLEVVAIERLELENLVLGPNEDLVVVR